jgi:acyl-CoA reductase-like NAD-dependent aldehyde dehydrogenase
MRREKLLLAGQWSGGDAGTLDVRSPWDGRAVARVARAGTAQLRQAAEAAAAAAPELAALAPERRAAILEDARARLLARRETAARALADEAGKPITQARAEVDRAGDTFRAAAHVARHPEMAARDLGGYASGAGRLALVRRVPAGPVLAITPFNFPLNLVVHKLAPAVAAGCPVVLKPASQTPTPALIAAGALVAAGLPPGAVSVLPAAAADMDALVDDPRFALLTFTGSAAVGWTLKRRAAARRVALELGGNAAAVVEPDAGDLAAVAARLAAGAFAYAGQSCISVQRILAHRRIYDDLKRQLVRAAKAVPAGDPADAATVCGPVIDTANADRIMCWIASARKAGARLLCGGTRRGAVIAPTLLEGVPPDEPVAADEVFGPVAALWPYDDFEEALARVNASRYGLQAGIFTRDITRVRRAWDVLEVGAVIQGDMPTWRSDPMPYGGVKDSGLGREGPAWAYLEMTEERMLVLNR